MFDAKKLFNERFSAHVQETNRYLKYIFNGHMAIFILFLISAAAVFYQQWLQQIPENFPTSFIMAVIFALLITIIPVRTLTKEPDLYFLLPVEHQLDPYFKRCLSYSFVLFLFILLFLLAIFGPLYFHTFPARSGQDYLFTLIIIAIFTFWSLLSNWWLLKSRQKWVRGTEKMIRFVITFLSLYFFIDGKMINAAIFTVLFALLFVYNGSKAKQQVALAFDVLIEKDRDRMQLFYRIANMFIDVPHLKAKIKRRQMLTSLFGKVPFKQKHTYDYLYRLTFIRSGDYLGLYIRLIIIGGLFIYFVPNIGFKFIFAFLFLYLSIFQLFSLYSHYRVNMWLDLYPIPHSAIGQAVVKLLFLLAVIQTVLFSLLFLLSKLYSEFFIMLFGGLLFVYVFIFLYGKQKVFQ